jgi:hypothetical protein
MGGGILSMHFVAMLAFIMPIPMSYDIGGRSGGKLSMLLGHSRVNGHNDGDQTCRQGILGKTAR